MLGGYACVFCSFDWILGSMLGLQYFDVVRLTMVCVILRCCNLLQVNDGQRGVDQDLNIPMVKSHPKSS